MTYTYQFYGYNYQNRLYSVLVLILPVWRGHPQCVEPGGQSGPDWASGYWGRLGEPPVVGAFPARS